MRIRDNIVCRTTLAIGVAVFRNATLVIHGIFICHSAMAMRGKHNNQLKEGRAVKMPATKAKQQATTSRHDKRTRGRRNTNASAMTAMGTMTLVTTAPTTMTTKTDALERYIIKSARWSKRVP
jgi:hypothetical protein